MSQRKGDLVDASLRVSDHADRSTRLAPEATRRGRSAPVVPRKRTLHILHHRKAMSAIEVPAGAAKAPGHEGERHCDGPGVSILLGWGNDRTRRSRGAPSQEPYGVNLENWHEAVSDPSCNLRQPLSITHRFAPQS